MEQDFTAIERAVPPKRMVYSDFACDDFRLRSQELPLADQFNRSSAASQFMIRAGHTRCASLGRAAALSAAMRSTSLSFKVQVGPPQITIHQGQTALVTEPDGQITWPSEKGLYFLDTRIISNWAIYANGEPWELLNGGPISYYAARIFVTNKSIVTEDGPIHPRTLGLTISRSISGGLHEDLDITNYSMKPVRFQLEVAFRSDFADVFEVKSGHIVRRGQITTEWSERQQRLRSAYSNRDFHRAVITPWRGHRARQFPPMSGSVSRSRLRQWRLGTRACSTR